MCDRIEYQKGDRYYKIMIDGFIVALCPSEETAKMCFFALTAYKENIAQIVKQSLQYEEKETNAKQ